MKNRNQFKKTIHFETLKNEIFSLLLCVSNSHKNISLIKLLYWCEVQLLVNPVFF